MTSPPIIFTSRSARQTRSLGRKLGAVLQPGDVVLLSGELGAGKTTFVQGIAQGIGFTGSVSSKSFVLLGEYRGRITLYHADLYRLEDPQQVLDLGLDDVCADGALVVEWPERAPGALPDEHLLVCFEVLSASGRRLRLEPRGQRAARLAAAMAGRR